MAVQSKNQNVQLTWKAIPLTGLRLVGTES
jgi:hypothetical protein